MLSSSNFVDGVGACSSPVMPAPRICPCKLPASMARRRTTQAPRVAGHETQPSPGTPAPVSLTVDLTDPTRSPIASQRFHVPCWHNVTTIKRPPQCSALPSGPPSKPTPIPWLLLSRQEARQALQQCAHSLSRPPLQRLTCCSCVIPLALPSSMPACRTLCHALRPIAQLERAPALALPGPCPPSSSDFLVIFICRTSLDLARCMRHRAVSTADRLPLFHRALASRAPLTCAPSPIASGAQRGFCIHDPDGNDSSAHACIVGVCDV